MYPFVDVFPYEPVTATTVGFTWRSFFCAATSHFFDNAFSIGLAIASAMSIDSGANRAGAMSATMKNAPTTNAPSSGLALPLVEIPKTVDHKLTEKTTNPTRVETTHTAAQMTASRLARAVHWNFDDVPRNPSPAGHNAENPRATAASTVDHGSNTQPWNPNTSSAVPHSAVTSSGQPDRGRALPQPAAIRSVQLNM